MPRIPLLQVRDLSLGFGGLNAPTAQVPRVVQELDLSLDAGQTFALVGESGSGKSLTALALMRLLPLSGRILSGEVRWRGENLLARPESAMRSIRGGEMAMVFQEPGSSLNPVLTVGRQLDEVLRLHRAMDGTSALAEAKRLLDAVGIADSVRRLGEYPFQMSGGMKQRVMIALALAGDPALLLADEPTTALDVTVQAQILALLKELQAARGMAMLLISHDLGIVGRMADAIGVMYAGELVEVLDVCQGGAGLHAACHPYTQALLAALPEASRRGQPLAAIAGQVPSVGDWPAGCRFAPRCTLADDRCHRESPTWTTLREGHRVRCFFWDQRAQRPAEPEISARVVLPHAQAPALALQELAVHFPIRRGLLKRTVGAVRAVDGVSLRVEKGQTVALVGESGCGKTTVGKGALGLLPLSGGSVSLRDGAISPGTHEWRQRVQMVFQDPFASLNPRRSVGEIIVEGMEALGIGDASHRSDRVAELLHEVGLDASMSLRYPHEFSGGQRQRIAIARALAVSPEVIICDEPTSALDVSVQAQILNLMRRLQREHGLAYLFITHNLAAVSYLADRVAVMYLGRIVEEGPAEIVMRAPRHPYTASLMAAVPSLGAGGSDELGSGELAKDFLQTRLAGEVPSPSAPPKGCHFHPRCPSAQEVCRREYPSVSHAGVGHQAHRVCCHFPLS